MRFTKTTVEHDSIFMCRVPDGFWYYRAAFCYFPNACKISTTSHRELRLTFRALVVWIRLFPTELLPPQRWDSQGGHFLTGDDSERLFLSPGGKHRHGNWTFSHVPRKSRHFAGKDGKDGEGGASSNSVNIHPAFTACDITKPWAWETKRF